MTAIVRNVHIDAAKLAAKFAQEIGLPKGNHWEPRITRSLEMELACNSVEDVEASWRFRLGLDDEYE